MLNKPREILKELDNGTAKLSKTFPQCTEAFSKLGATALKPGALDWKTKELISAALGLAARCEYCIVHHVHEAYKAGASRQELLETACVATFMGGGPNLTYNATLFLDSVDEFAKDLQ